MGRHLDLTCVKNTSKHRVYGLLISLLFAASLECPYADDEGHTLPALKCNDNEEFGLRIQGTNKTNAGHLEICHNREWGVICGNHWTQSEANVACRQLGFRGGSALTAEVLRSWSERGNYTKGQGRKKEWLDYVYCDGQEEQLLDCSYGVSTWPVKYGLHVKPVPCFQIMEPKLVGVDCFATVTDVGKDLKSSTNFLKNDTTSLTAATIGVLPTAEGTVTTSAVQNKTSTTSTALTNSTTDESRKSSSRFLAPSVVVAVVSILLILYVIRMMSLAINLRRYCEQLRKKLAAIEARKNELILSTERQPPSDTSTSSIAGADKKRKTKQADKSKSTSALATNDDTIRLYSDLSKTNVYPSMTTTTGSTFASAEPTYTEAAAPAVVAYSRI